MKNSIHTAHKPDVHQPFIPTSRHILHPPPRDVHPPTEDVHPPSPDVRPPTVDEDFMPEKIEIHHDTEKFSPQQLFLCTSHLAG